MTKTAMDGCFAFYSYSITKLTQYADKGLFIPVHFKNASSVMGR